MKRCTWVRITPLSQKWLCCDQTGWWYNFTPKAVLAASSPHSPVHLDAKKGSRSPGIRWERSKMETWTCEVPGQRSRHHNVDRSRELLKDCCVPRDRWSWAVSADWQALAGLPSPWTLRSQSGPQTGAGPRVVCSHSAPNTMQHSHTVHSSSSSSSSSSRTYRLTWHKLQ